MHSRSLFSCENTSVACLGATAVLVHCIPNLWLLFALKSKHKPTSADLIMTNVDESINAHEYLSLFIYYHYPFVPLSSMKPDESCLLCFVGTLSVNCKSGEFRAWKTVVMWFFTVWTFFSLVEQTGPSLWFCWYLAECILDTGFY